MDDLEAVAEQLQNVAEMTLAGDLDPEKARAATNALQAKQGSLRLLREWYVVVSASPPWKGHPRPVPSDRDILRRIGQLERLEKPSGREVTQHLEA